MVDFSDKNKTYRLFDLVMKKYYISGDIIFSEKPRCESIEMIKFIDYEINKTNFRDIMRSISMNHISIEENKKSSAFDSTRFLSVL